MIMNCSICDNEIDFQYHPETGEVMWREGHNAQPLTNGRCFTECNETKVIPTRIAMFFQRPAKVEDKEGNTIYECQVTYEGDE